MSIDQPLFYTCKHLKYFGDASVEKLNTLIRRLWKQLVKVLTTNALNNVSLIVMDLE